jgi:hypothetical protein
VAVQPQAWLRKETECRGVPKDVFRCPLRRHALYHLTRRTTAPSIWVRERLRETKMCTTPAPLRVPPVRPVAELRQQRSPLAIDSRVGTLWSTLEDAVYISL